VYTLINKGRSGFITTAVVKKNLLLCPPEWAREQVKIIEKVVFLPLAASTVLDTQSSKSRVAASTSQ
jgi:hypothetical protein